MQSIAPQQQTYRTCIHAAVKTLHLIRTLYDYETAKRILKLFTF